MTGMLVTPGGKQRVRIQDISVAGAHVFPEGKVKANVDVLLTKKDVTAAAWVAWLDDNSVGLKFYRELTPQEMESIFGR